VPGRAFDIPLTLALGWFSLCFGPAPRALARYAVHKGVQSSRFGPHNGLTRGFHLGSPRTPLRWGHPGKRLLHPRCGAASPRPVRTSMVLVASVPVCERAIPRAITQVPDPGSTEGSVKGVSRAERGRSEAETLGGPETSPTIEDVMARYAAVVMSDLAFSFGVMRSVGGGSSTRSRCAGIVSRARVSGQLWRRASATAIAWGCR
jgi:hypothetical protein